MAKKINWDEYNIRTLTYYQKQGGVFSDLITVLQKARTDKSVVGYIPKHTPARLLNIASYIADLAMADKAKSGQVIVEQKQQYSNRLKDDQYLVFSIVYILIGDLDCEETNRQLMQYIGTSGICRTLLKSYSKISIKGKLPLQEVLSSEERKRYEEKIRLNEDTIATQSSHISELEQQVSQLLQENELAQAAAFKGSKLDKTLTLDYIISQIEHRRTFKNSCQLIDLLKTSKLMRMATDEEVAKIDKVEQQMLDASVPTVHNDIKESQVFQAPVVNPTFQLPIGFTEEMLKEAIEQYLKKRNDGYSE